RARAVLVEPAEAPDELGRPTVAPQLQVVLLDGVYAELAGLTAADPFGPDVAAQPVGKEPELVRRRDGHRHPASFRPEAGPLQGDGVAPGREVEVHRAGRPGAGLPRPAAVVDEFERDVVQGGVAFVAHVSDQHEEDLRQNGSWADPIRNRRADLPAENLAPAVVPLDVPAGRRHSLPWPAGGDDLAPADPAMRRGSSLPDSD